jgi:hypothetical protein
VYEEAVNPESAKDSRRYPTQLAARRHRTSDRSSQGRAPHGRNYLAHHAGDAVNAALAAAGYNFHLLLRWLELLLPKFFAAHKAAAALQWVLKIENFTHDLLFRSWLLSPRSR